MKSTTYTAGIFLLGLAVGGGTMYAVIQQSKPGIQKVEPSSEISRLKTPNRELPSVDVLYTNEQYGFSFRYPRGLIFQEFDEAGGAKTIVFQKPNDVKKGFQIYITPYEGGNITGDRILYDASGPVSDLQEENLTENLLVATFISEAPIVGKTREIWWLHGGYLFELTTYASLDGWIRDIVKTVEFKKD